jgi:oxygen-dependent protoporphyrinogen oxidase
MKTKISIVGGGFSGLTLAYYLNKKGIQVQIFEKQNWGGLLKTHVSNDQVIEEAANAILWSHRLQEIADDINCKLVKPLPQSRNKWIWRKGCKRWPIGFRSTIKLILFIFKYIFFRSKIKPKNYETLTAWARNHLNEEILDYLLSPGLQGIYAGDPEKLSASLVLSALFSKRPKKGPSVSPVNGMGEFVKLLKAFLISQSVDCEIKEINKLSEIEGPVVVATTLQELIRLRPELQDSQLEHLNLVRVSTSFSSLPQKALQGFGVLFPDKENFFSLGVLFNSSIFSFNQNNYNESWILGGARNQDVINLTDTEIKDRIQKDRFRVMNEDSNFRNFFVKKHSNAYVHYDLNLERWLIKNCDQLQDNKNLRWTTGNYLGKLGLSQILDQNFELANRIYGVLCQK